MEISFHLQVIHWWFFIFLNSIEWMIQNLVENTTKNLPQRTKKMKRKIWHHNQMKNKQNPLTSVSQDTTNISKQKIFQFRDGLKIMWTRKASRFIKMNLIQINWWDWPLSKWWSKLFRPNWKWGEGVIQLKRLNFNIEYHQNRGCFFAWNEPSSDHFFQHLGKFL